MGNYALTVFQKDGKTLLNEVFEAANHEEAKEVGTKKLEKSGYTEHTSIP